MKLYVFNPDTDMALAHNNENYIAPLLIRKMAHDLALLPAWYAASGGSVLAPSAYNDRYLKEMQSKFALPVQLITEPELPELTDAQLFPWGWNLAIRSRLLKNGIAERRLPTVELITEYRKLSSRKVAYEVLNVLNSEDVEGCCGQSYYLPTLSACKAFVEGQEACVLKAPWSGSGKGLNWCKGMFTPSIEGWCEHVIKEQGGVLGEMVYNKTEDFAMEFYSTGSGEVKFMGYSLFSTNNSGAYSGNILLSLGDIEKRIEKHVSLSVLTSIRKKMGEMLTHIYGSSYVGYLGVDMMVCLLPNNQCAIHPCVEINMRMNMGVVSCLFHENFLASDSRGRFQIEYYPTNKELLEKHEQDLKTHPLIVKDGRLTSGYLPLVPVTPQSNYRAYVCTT